jgi:hypothetical protein
MKLRSVLALLAACAAVVAFAACGGDDTPADSSTSIGASTSSPSVTVPATDARETTVASTTAASVPVTTDALGNDFTCGGAGPLGGALMDIANENSPTPGIEYLVTEVVISAKDPSWGRGQVSAPPDSGVEGFIGVAHCEDLGEGPAWSMHDAGTSGVGCMAEVPDDISYDC